MAALDAGRAQALLPLQAVPARAAVIKSKRQEDIRNLLDLDAPLSEHDKAVVAKVSPVIESKPVTRQPYDSLYVKLKRQESF